jgi:hypothetical protein
MRSSPSLVVSTCSFPVSLPSSPQARALPGRRASRSGDHDVVAELRQPLLLELYVAALGAQRAAQRHLALRQARLSGAGDGQPKVGPCQKAEAFGAPVHVRGVPAPQGQRAAGGQPPAAAGDGKVCDTQLVVLQLRAQLPVPEEHAIRRNLQRQGFPPRASAQAHACQRAAAAHLRRYAPFDPGVVEKRL